MDPSIKNPFKPTAGANPPLLVGRADVLEAWQESLDNGPGSPGRITIYTGARGVGKTVMLNEVGEISQSYGWRVIHETATTGVFARIRATIRKVIAEYESKGSRRLTGIQLPFNLGGVATEFSESEPTLEADELRHLLDILRTHETGLLITLDEIHKGAITDLRQIATLTQHMIREDRDLAVAMAGLPTAVSQVLQDDVITFLRRADKHSLADVAVDDVEQAFFETITAGNRTIDNEALHMCAVATYGYPFLIQLVGYHVWRSATGVHIDVDAAERGIASALRKLGSLVHEPSLADLSDTDRTFLAAMAVDSGPAKMSDIARRMSVDNQYANVYRRRLLAAEIIQVARHGYVNFKQPFLREYLREHAATQGLQTHEESDFDQSNQPILPDLEAGFE